MLRYFRTQKKEFIMSNYAALAVIGELTKATANNAANTLAIMANMDIQT